jgi:hypothetical protein
MRTISANGTKMALFFTMADIGQGLSFFSEERDFLQVGAWRYEAGKELATHNHNTVERAIDRTQEFLFVVQGKAKAFIHDENDQIIDTLELNAHEGLILFAGGHGYEIMTDDTVVIETKNGPYPGAEADRRRF